ncbi:cytochrome P450 [Neolentinus lepideus HHB14362 ss-1]|uniref:Cytochrome P450 n=1 Tax=Neolentinus lepideus HHB14362 ss-1 TaxID=1314782 RepID=A0A165UEZ9_9AGAM|nr:cytochrome P450 [Neolentinus lepideus HHB14362 ss-1]
MAFSLITGLDAILALLVLFLVRRVTTGSRRPPAPYPPGPKGLPLVGNILDMPTKHPWKTIAVWCELYGGINYVNVLGKPFVFLNSPNAAYDMLDMKGLIYSDRPYLTMACELVGWDWSLVLKRFGEEHRTMRRLFHLFMGTHSSVEQFVPIEEYEMKGFLKHILNNPEDLGKSIRRTAGAVILQVTYGYEPQEYDDPLLELNNRAMEQTSIMISLNVFLVDVLPILKHIPAWFPGARFNRIAPEWAKCTSDLQEIPLRYVKDQMSKGSALPSFTSQFLEGNHVTPKEDTAIKRAAASMYVGGADTIVSSVTTFFLTMMLYPEAQKKAQAEIDAVIGNDRLPSLADRDQLPYVDALAKKVFRWHPVVPLDDVHDGYFIPEGTFVIANIWKFLHDPKTYVDPMTFNPDRFLGSQSEYDP